MRLNVVKEFSEVARSLGARLFDDEQGPNKPTNPDYWFPQHNVIVELKCLTEDLRSDKNFNSQVARMYREWAAKGLVPPGMKSFSTSKIPEACAREFMNHVKARLESSVLRKANRQMKSTKASISPDAKGLLLLVNEGNYLFPPKVMLHLLARAINAQYHGIDSVIYASVNEPVCVSAYSEPVRFWIDGTLRSRNPPPLAFREMLANAWMAHLSRVSGEPIIELAGTSEMIERMEFRGTDLR